MPGLAPLVDMNGPGMPGVEETITASKNGPLVLIGPNATISDADASNFANAYLSIYGRGMFAEDRLFVVNQGTAAGQISTDGFAIYYQGLHIGNSLLPPGAMPGTALYIAFNADANASSAQALLHAIAYQVSPNTISLADRYISVQLKDADGNVSSEMGAIGTLIHINVVNVNAAPIITISDTAVRYLEPQRNLDNIPVAIDPGIKIADADSQRFFAATVQIAGGFRPTEDVLLGPSFGVASTYNAATGTLTFTDPGGNFDLATWQRILAGVTYYNSSHNPFGTTRTFSFTINDGNQNSAPAAKTISIVATPDAPIIDLNGSAFGSGNTADYTEQASAVSIAPQAIITDVDSTSFGGGRLVISQLVGADLNAILAITNFGVGIGQIGISGTAVTFGGTVIGNLADGSAGSLLVNLNASADIAAVQALVRALTYYNGSDLPPSFAALSVTLSDGTGMTSDPVQAGIRITGVLDSATLDLNGMLPGRAGTAVYTVGHALTVIAPKAMVIDELNENLAGGTLTFRLINGQPGDILGADENTADSGLYLFDNGEIFYWGAKIGTVFQLEGRIALDGNQVSARAVEALIRSLGFANILAEPGHQNRTVEITLTPGSASPAVTERIEISVASVLHIVRNDFNSDHRSDMLWRDASGAVTNWLGQGNGGFVGNSTNAFNQVDTSWQIVGTADFNGDGRSDILWRHSSGAISEWLGQASGGFIGNTNVNFSVGTDWQIAGTGDFNGDGRDDILWRNASGTLTNWLGQANGGFVGNNNAFNPIDNAWRVAAVGDFNGDGRDDIVFRHISGTVSEWLGQANGGYSSNHALVNMSVGNDWKIIGSGDFNGDGRDDILWRNTSGVVSNWLGQANGSFVSNAAASTSVGMNWHIVAIGDYNGDGRDDLAWRDDNGNFSEWLAQPDGGFLSNHAIAGAQVGTNWQVQSPDVFFL